MLLSEFLPRFRVLLISGVSLAFASLCSLCVADDSLAIIIEKIRSQEQLYNDIELRAVFNYENKLHMDDVELNRSKSTSKHFVSSGGKHFLDWRQSDIGNDGSTSDYSSLQGYDGTTTRISEPSVANIYHSRHDDARISKPHTLLLEYDRIHGSLADHLSGSVFKDEPLSVTILPNETVDGLNCIVLRCTYSRPKDGIVKTIRMIWLAVDRNYIPCQHVGYATGYSTEVPLEVGRVASWKEIEGGIWFPISSEIQVFDEILAKAGEKVLSNLSKLQIESVELNPVVDDSLFSNIPFKSGVKVYEIKQGKIVDSYVEGAGRLVKIRRSRGAFGTEMAAIAGMI
jgi:hypothetical protein